MDVVAGTAAVSRRYGNVVAVDEVTLQVRRGEVVGLLGPNGAGKSTLINLLCGLRHPTSGSVELFGGDPRDPARRRALGTTPQETGLPPNLRVREVVDFVGAHYADPVPTAEMLDRVGLTDQARRQTGGLSGGQRRRLSVALAFVGRPDLVLLDEPTTGLDVEARREVWQLVREFVGGGGTVLLSSHTMDEVEALAERVVVVHRGRVMADGPVDRVRSTVPLRRLRVTAPVLPDLPGVHRAGRDGDRHELWAEDADGVVRALVRADVPFRDLEVATASLEEAFLSLTHGAAPS